MRVAPSETTKLLGIPPLAGGQSSQLQLPIFTLMEMFPIIGDKAAGIREIIAKTESGLRVAHTFLSCTQRCFLLG